MFLNHLTQYHVLHPYFRITKHLLVIDGRMCIFLSLIASNPLNSH